MVRIVSLLATHNEERFIEPCLEHLTGQGLDVYLIDNQSTDRTVERARRYAGRGLVGAEVMPRTDLYSWNPILARKEELAAELEADWFMHVDADEIRLAPAPWSTLAEALAEVDRQGYNAVEFQEFTFVPTREDPDHDHPGFQETMRRYYPYLPRSPNQLKAWKRQGSRVDLVSSGGHLVDFPGLRMCPEPFPMRHYLFLSVEHAVRKYVERQYDPAEVDGGLHRARSALRAEAIALQPENELRPYVSDELLDATEPLTRHPLFATS